MEKMKLYTKRYTDERNEVHQLEYFLRTCSAEQGRIYGIEIRKNDAAGNMENDMVEGLCESRNEAEKFLLRLAEGLAFPVELPVLCDDFITERESERKQAFVRAAS